MNTNTPRHHQAGSSMILALTLVAAVATASATAYFYVANQAKAGTKSINLLKARSIAESGLTIAYNQARANIALVNSQDSWPWTNFDGGQYMVAPTTVASNLISLIATGQFNGVQAQARMDLHYYPSTTSSSGGGGGSGGSLNGPYNYTNVLYVGGNCSWSGSPTFNGGCAFINGTFTASGSGSWGKTTNLLVFACTGALSMSGSGTLNADTVMTPSISMTGSCDINANTVVLSTVSSYSITGSGHLNGTKVAGTVPVSAPPSIELSPFYTIACQNHQVFTNYSYSGSVGYSPPGGVLYNVGVLNISGSGTFKGCFISEGGISISGSGTYNAYTNSWPTFYNRSGSFTMSGSGNTSGFVYSGGALTCSGSGDILDGPVIVASTLTWSGSGKLKLGIPTTGFVVTPPVVNAQQTTNTAQRLVVTGWQ